MPSWISAIKETREKCCFVNQKETSNNCRLGSMQQKETSNTRRLGLPRHNKCRLANLEGTLDERRLVDRDDDSKMGRDINAVL